MQRTGISNSMQKYICLQYSPSRRPLYLQHVWCTIHPQTVSRFSNDTISYYFAGYRLCEPFTNYNLDSFLIYSRESNRFIMNSEGMLCLKEQHGRLPVRYLCLDEQCKGKRLLCQVCIRDGHSKHSRSNFDPLVDPLARLGMNYDPSRSSCLGTF